MPSYAGQEMLIPGSLRGFRWFLANDESRYGIGGVGTGATWRVTMNARCYHRGFRYPPDSSCSAPNPDPNHYCGIYGFYTPAHSEVMRYQARILAVIEVSGRVLMGGTGFRAQKARILAVAGPLNDRSRGRLRAAGVVVYDKPQDLIAEWPPDDVSGLVELEPAYGDFLADHGAWAQVTGRILDWIKATRLNRQRKRARKTRRRRRNGKNR